MGSSVSVFGFDSDGGTGRANLFAQRDWHSRDRIDRNREWFDDHTPIVIGFRRGEQRVRAGRIAGNFRARHIGCPSALERPIKHPAAAKIIGCDRNRPKGLVYLCHSRTIVRTGARPPSSFSFPGL
ncbi:MAG: hypothetical protein O9277_11465 [Magnetospirillum sp.]|nr:hypothetical protein [Magnetospirillum sp.]